MTPVERVRALIARLDQARDEALVLLAEVTPAEPPAPVPAPPPPPPPPPPPAPAPPPSAGPLTATPLQLHSIVSIDLWHTQSRYERDQYLTEWPAHGEVVRVRLRGVELARGGARQALRSPRYTLLVDGEPRASLEVPAGATEAWITLPLPGIAPGWHRLDLDGLAAGESAPTWWAYRYGGPAPDVMPVCTSSYDVIYETGGAHLSGMVPARYAPTVVPLVPRPTPDVPAPTRRVLYATDLVPWRDTNIWRPARLRDGALGMLAAQPYPVEEMIAARPSRAALLDGPRGVGAVSFATHLAVGRGGKVYFCDPWRVGKVMPDGTVVTLAGYRHRQPRTHWEHAQDLELVGDWAAIPPERRGFHELWGLAWDERTLAVDEAADPIPSEGDERPHISGPVAFVADSQNNRVCRLAWERDRHGPATVTEFLAGLRDPWDVLCVAGELYVAERQAHRIAVYDATSGAYLRTLVQGVPVSTVDRRRAATGPSIDAVRAQPCQAPEGLYHLDGWIYWGSNAALQVRRVRLDGSGMEVVAQWARDTNTKFAKIAVSDGTFGRRGMVAVSTWTNARFGLPLLFDEAGREVDIRGDGAGPGRRWPSWGYSTACAIAGGRLVLGAMTEGIVQISAALPTDGIVTIAEWSRATAAWHEAGRYILHGDGGFGFLGLPLPWGESPDIDAYLTWHGHTNPQGHA